MDVRVVAATHQDLPAEIRAGRFREDLFYRLRVVEIRDARRCASAGRTSRASRGTSSRASPRARAAARRSLSRDAVKALLDYPFPGNVRELENLLEGAAALVSGDTIEAADLQFGIAREAEGDLRLTSVDLSNVENAHIRRVLAQVKGNKSRAAKLLGVSRRTLYRKRI